MTEWIWMGRRRRAQTDELALLELQGTFQSIGDGLEGVAGSLEMRDVSFWMSSRC